MRQPRQRGLIAGALLLLLCAAPPIWAQGLHVTPEPIPPSTWVDFGTVYIGKATTKVFTIQNTGVGDVAVTNLSIWNMWQTPYTLASPPALPYLLGSGEWMTVIIRFAPPDFSFWDGKLKIYSDSPTTPYIEVALRGFGDFPPPAKVGAFRPGVGFFLDYNGNGLWEGCVVDRCLWVGLSGDIPLVGDWNGSGTDKVGAFRPSDGTFYLDYNGNGVWDGCGTDRCLPIGMDGDIPLVGDWNGTGTSKVGAFRPSDGTFYLDYNGNGTWDGCGVDRCLQIGMLGDIPLVGDWNGSGTAKVGAFRPSDGTFYLDYNGNGQWDGCATDRCLQIGMVGDVPLVGDWNGSGTSKVGAFRPTDGTFYLDHNGNGTWDGCATDRCLQIGMLGDIPLVGDWNSTGSTKVGAFRPSDGMFYLDYNGNGVWNGCGIDRCLPIGLSGDTPLVGRW